MQLMAVGNRKSFYFGVIASSYCCSLAVYVLLLVCASMSEFGVVINPVACWSVNDLLFVNRLDFGWLGLDWIPVFSVPVFFI